MKTRKKQNLKTIQGNYTFYNLVFLKVICFTLWSLLYFINNFLREKTYNMNRFSDIECSFKRLPPVYGYHSEKLVSIEKTLGLIETQIDELPRYIKS